MWPHLISHYKRWRRGRGFGVHSPFAYSFVTETLRQTLPYYAYDSIDAMLSGGVRSDGAITARRLKQIFRIAVRFNPSSVAFLCGRDEEVLRRVVALAVPKATMDASPGDADLVIVACGGHEFRPRTEAVCVFADKDDSDRLVCDNVWNGITHGMRFDNARGMTVIVAAAKLPRQRFDITF